MLKKNSPLLLAELRTFAPYTSIHFSKRQSNSLTHYYISQVIWTPPLHWNYSLSMSVRTKFYLFSLSFAILQTIQWPLPHFKNYFSHRFCSLSTALLLSISSDSSSLSSDSNVANLLRFCILFLSTLYYHPRQAYPFLWFQIAPLCWLLNICLPLWPIS